jgi:thiol-disulfide isomerase/thioredoxin
MNKSNKSGARPSANRRLKWLLVALVCAGLAATVFRQPLQQTILLRSLLMSEAPSETAFLAAVDRAKDPFPFLERIWNTKKIPQRALVAAYLKDHAGTNPELFWRAEALLISGSLDVDASVRELALATLSQQKHPAVAGLAASWLHDADPEMRLLALQYLRKQDPAVALRSVFNSLDDPDLRVVTGADAALRNWTKQDFNIRITHANPNLSGGTNSAIEPANLQIIREGVGRWKDWWTRRQQDYPARNPTRSLERVPPQLLPVANFQLKDLNGRTARLSDFRGKVVLLNFWTTWCPGCLLEIPDLIELQKNNAERLVIVGISLDGQPERDEHGHLAETDPGDDATKNGSETAGKAGRTEVRQRVEWVVKDKGINYLVLLDPRSEVGRRFNGGELPTNVLIDSQGYARRRFIGGRSVKTFQAMIDELISQKAAP